MKFVLKFDNFVSVIKTAFRNSVITAVYLCRPTKHLNIDHKEYNTKFVMRQAKREDSGEYTITAQNSSGRDSATVTVTVTDKPGKPEGPLKVGSTNTATRQLCSRLIECV